VSMQSLTEQHLVAAKLVREYGARRTGVERELLSRNRIASSPVHIFLQKTEAASIWKILTGHRLPRIGV
jgi:hypothetical protein